MDESLIDVICTDSSKKDCAIKLDGVYCDGYKENASIGVFSHFHEDHVKRLPLCISSYDILIAHNVTFEGINALTPSMKLREQWMPQDYDTKYNFEGGIVRLLKANHIPGSAQVHVEQADGKTLLYSGDFGYPDVQIREADYLVIDSTHGDPWYDSKTNRKSVQNRLFEHVEEQLKSTQCVLVLASSGTLQEIVHHFEACCEKRMDTDIEFVLETKQKKVLHSIYKNEKSRFRDIIEYRSRKFWDLLRTGKKCIIFSTQLDVLDDDLSGFYKILVDRYKFANNHTIVPFDGGCRFNLAAHASIDGIYQYVESVNPSYVVTDNSRSQYGRQLAKLIEQKFPKIKVVSRPSYA